MRYLSRTLTYHIYVGRLIEHDLQVDDIVPAHCDHNMVRLGEDVAGCRGSGLSGHIYIHQQVSQTL